MAAVKRPAHAATYTGPATPDRRLASMFAPRSTSAPATVERVCLLGSYDPAGPGRPAFLPALRASLIADRPGLTVDVVCSDRHASAASAEPPEVVHRVGSAVDSGRAAAQILNTYNAAVIHYQSTAYADGGGQVLDILEWISIPVVCVMQEVPLDPTPRQRSIVEKLTTSADAVVVLAEADHQPLLHQYRVERRKLMVIDAEPSAWDLAASQYRQLLNALLRRPQM